MERWKITGIDQPDVTGDPEGPWVLWEDAKELVEDIDSLTKRLAELVKENNRVGEERDRLFHWVEMVAPDYIAKGGDA